MEIKASDIVVTTITQRVDDVMHHCHITKETFFYCVKYFLQSGADIVSLAFPHFFPYLADAFNPFTKNEHVFFANFLGNFDIGAVHGPNDEAAIHHELHV